VRYLLPSKTLRVHKLTSPDSLSQAPTLGEDDKRDSVGPSTMSYLWVERVYL